MVSNIHLEINREYDMFPLASTADPATSRFFSIVQLHEEEQLFLTVYNYNTNQLISNISLATFGQKVIGLVYHPTQDVLYGIEVEDEAEKSQKTLLVRIDFNTGN